MKLDFRAVDFAHKSYRDLLAAKKCPKDDLVRIQAADVKCKADLYVNTSCAHLNK